MDEDGNCESMFIPLGSSVWFLAQLQRRLPYQEDESFYHQITVMLASQCCCAELKVCLSEDDWLKLTQDGKIQGSWQTICSACGAVFPVRFDPFDDLSVSYFVGGGEYNQEASGSTDAPGVRALIGPLIEDLYHNPLEAVVLREQVLDEVEADCQALVARLGWLHDHDEFYRIPREFTPAGCKK